MHRNSLGKMLRGCVCNLPHEVCLFHIIFLLAFPGDFRISKLVSKIWYPGWPSNFGYCGSQEQGGLFATYNFLNWISIAKYIGVLSMLCKVQWFAQ